MRGHRQRRLADFIQEEVSQIIREEVSDPELQGMITISAVEVSPDLKRARILYQVHGDAEAEQAVARGFERAKAYIRHLLAQRLYTKFVPEITFEPDRREEAQDRLEALFEQLRKGHEGP